MAAASQAGAAAGAAGEGREGLGEDEGQQRGWGWQGAAPRGQGPAAGPRARLCGGLSAADAALGVGSQGGGVDAMVQPKLNVPYPCVTGQTLLFVQVGVGYSVGCRNSGVQAASGWSHRV